MTANTDQSVTIRNVLGKPVWLEPIPRLPHEKVDFTHQHALVVNVYQRDNLYYFITEGREGYGFAAERKSLTPPTGFFLPPTRSFVEKNAELLPPHQQSEIVRRWNEAYPVPIFLNAPAKQVYIPSRDEHEGLYGVHLWLYWHCPVCGQPRGNPFQSVSFDGSRRLHCSGWANPCGHLDKYAACRDEAAHNGLNRSLSKSGQWT